MTQTESMDASQIARLLAAARDTIAAVHHCWVATRAIGGGANARAVRCYGGSPADDPWTRRFICRRVSRKVAEMRRDPLVTLAFQTDSGDAYVALGGRVALIDDPPQIHDLWPVSAAGLFPDGFAEAHMLVARVAIDRIEIHVKGLTSPPFGHGRTLLERVTADAWRFVPAAD